MKLFKPPAPTPEMVRDAREAAEHYSAEHGIPIESLCVVGTPEGVVEVVVLDHPVEVVDLDHPDEEETSCH